MIINNTVHTQDSINISSASFLLKVKKKKKEKEKKKRSKMGYAISMQSM